MTRTEIISQIIVPTLKRLADERFKGELLLEIKDGYVIGGKQKQELAEFLRLRELKKEQTKLT